jgi:thioredoxin 2
VNPPPVVVPCAVCGKRNRMQVAAKGSPRCGNCGSPLPWIVEADDSSYADVVESADVPVLVDVWAPWCGPCRAVSPALEALATDLAGRVKLAKVNADESPRTATQLSAQAIPTLVVIDRGREVARQVGAAPAQALREWLDRALTDVTQARQR